MPYAMVLLAERFGGWPWEIETAPADRVTHYLNLLGVEGEARSALDGLEPDEPFIREE